MSAVGDDTEVCFTLTAVASVVGANALLPFSKATFEERLESAIVPVILLAASELMTVAPCVPVTSPERFPVKFVALAAVVAVAALPVMLMLAVPDSEPALMLVKPAALPEKLFAVIVPADVTLPLLLTLKFSTPF